MAPRIGDRCFPRGGDHDGRAIGREQREELQARRHLRRLREHGGNVLGADRLDISDLPIAQMGQRFRRDIRTGDFAVHDARLLDMPT